MLNIKHLKICHRTAPIGLDEVPSFGWVLESDGQNVLQTAYQLIVSASNEVVWDSGKAESRESIAVSYAGKALIPNTLYHVHLTVWDNWGNMAQGDTSFETGILNPSRFYARWIVNAEMNLQENAD